MDDLNCTLKTLSIQARKEEVREIVGREKEISKDASYSFNVYNLN